MSLARVLMDATDAMAEADAAILEALSSGALADAPTEVSLALLHFGIAARNLCDAIVAHYAPQIGEPHVSSLSRQEGSSGSGPDPAIHGLSEMQCRATRLF